MGHSLCFSELNVGDGIRCVPCRGSAILDKVSVRIVIDKFMLIWRKGRDVDFAAIGRGSRTEGGLEGGVRPKIAVEELRRVDVKVSRFLRDFGSSTGVPSLEVAPRTWSIFRWSSSLVDPTVGVRSSRGSMKPGSREFERIEFDRSLVGNRGLDVVCLMIRGHELSLVGTKNGGSTT
ncbi:hypothetical protein CRG98_007190 [Punica granatum]|uniref:Uncharacterized protein n=1 Tax=Punica granatum TaxID=22663 RepID=A0A2I0KVE9_PUNGR|nr:hypothetical protein CRG98_007190 [Punica granatum]